MLYITFNFGVLKKPQCWVISIDYCVVPSINATKTKQNLKSINRVNQLRQTNLQLKPNHSLGKIEKIKCKDKTHGRLPIFECNIFRNRRLKIELALPESRNRKGFTFLETIAYADLLYFLKTTLD